MDRNGIWQASDGDVVEMQGTNLMLKVPQRPGGRGIGDTEIRVIATGPGNLEETNGVDIAITVIQRALGTEMSDPIRLAWVSTNTGN